MKLAFLFSACSARQIHATERLVKGEAEAIALGIELQTEYIILNEFATRREAMRLGLNAKGALAVIF